MYVDWLFRWRFIDCFVKTEPDYFWFSPISEAIWFHLIKDEFCSDLCHLGDWAVVELNLLLVHPDWGHPRQRFVCCMDLLWMASKSNGWWAQRPKVDDHHEGAVFLCPPHFVENDSNGFCCCFPQVLLPRPPRCTYLNLQRNRHLPP